MEKKYINPIVVQIKNNSCDRKEFKLFGFNEFNKKENFGNEKDISISSFGDNSYDFIFNDTCSSSFTIGKLRISTSSNKNYKEKLYLNEYDADKGVFTRREIALITQMDAYQHQSDIIDASINNEWIISKRSYISGFIHSDTSIVFSIFPKSEGFEMPVISGKNESPVIINTVKLPKIKKISKLKK